MSRPLPRSWLYPSSFLSSRRGLLAGQLSRRTPSRFASNEPSLLLRRKFFVLLRGRYCERFSLTKRAWTYIYASIEPQTSTEKYRSVFVKSYIRTMYFYKKISDFISNT